jgi:hypothetical protein
MTEDAMATDEMFDSSARSKGDFAGVFEYDGEVGYFYLYESGKDAGHKVAGAIRIFSGEAEFKQADIAVRWDGSERSVGLSICGQICAVFDADARVKYGGNYIRGVPSDIPSEVLNGFAL